MIKFLDLVGQYRSIKTEIDAAVSAVISEAAFVGGPYVQKFESEFARFVGANQCVGVGNGTDALEIAIEALALPPASEILVPANSFIASSEAVTRQGHRVVFVDCDPDTYVLSIEDVARRITPRTKAVIAVHLYGHPCDMDALLELAKKFGLKIIEDCAQAHGAKYKGRPVGSIGDVAAFSFYPGKNLGAYGDGGAITTNCEVLADRCRKIANHGRLQKYNHSFEGRNSRLDGLQAAVLSVKLKHLPEWTRKRIAAAEYYDGKLKHLHRIKLPKREIWAEQVYHLYVVQVSDRDLLRNHLAKAGIQTGIHYPTALPKLDAYRYLNQFSEELFANKADDLLLSLPIGEHLTEQDLFEVVDAISKYYASY